MLLFLKMKIMPGLFLALTFTITLLLPSPVFSIEIKDKNKYLIDTRGDDGDLYLNRISINKKFDSSAIEISAFGETQWNFDTTQWEKLLLGVEVSTTLYKYFYIGQSLQFISGQMLDYMTFSVDKTSIDTTTKLGLKFPLAEHFSFQIFEEYSLNLEEGRGGYTETIAEIFYQPKDLYSIGIGWHHTDRIHNFDTDYISSSVTLHF